MTEPTWTALDFAAVRAKLVEARELLRQAAAVGVAQDVAKLESLKELELHRQEQARRGPRRRRYR